MALTEKQKRALAGLATPGEDNQKFHAGVMPLAGDETPPPASEANSTKMTISLGIGIGM